MAETNQEKRVHGVVAEYTSVDTLLDACRRVRDAGYTRTDAFAPFPVHGIDKALGIRPTGLPWIALVAGLTGTAIAFAMQIWMNGIDYQYLISGKPFISTPAFIPVAFELTILLASFGAFFGMWALNRLPRFSNPMFTNPRFDRATDDTFFLFIDASDDRFDREGVEKFLAECGGEHIERVVEDDTPTEIPRFLLIGLGTVIAFSLIPALLVAKMRVSTSSSPRFHVFYDMDFSPAKGAQQTTTIFADTRASRPDVPGTVARGAYDADPDFVSGVDHEALTRLGRGTGQRLVASFVPQAEDGESGTDAPPVETAPTEEDETPWLTENPLELTEDLFRRGQSQFEIYCAVCHGADGRGNGLVNQRAQRILATTWTPPSNLLESNLHSGQYPDGKLFSTISYGIRKMGGYASQMDARDRWAVVAYVRALQLSQNAELEMVPAEMRDSIRTRKAEVDEQLREAAEAERRRLEEGQEQAQ